MEIGNVAILKKFREEAINAETDKPNEKHLHDVEVQEESYFVTRRDFEWLSSAST